MKNATFYVLPALNEEGSVAEVMEEMEDAYSEEEIRLVRIKFMSEVAN